MKLLYYRQGFANNSSSTHSIWFTKDSSKIKDRIYADYFGWEPFVLTSKDKILDYIANQVVEAYPLNVLANANLDNLKNEELRKKIKKLHLKRKKNSFKVHIDDQSRWVLPYDWYSKSKTICYEFINDLTDYLLNKNTLILGGSDQDKTQEWLIQDIQKVTDLKRNNTIMELTTLNSLYITDIFAKKENNIWIFFDTSFGNKLRFTFDDASYHRIEIPELVDVICSEYCRRDCSYCYLDCCTKRTNTFDYNKEKTLTMLRTLCNLGVFEIVLGGGDLLDQQDDFLIFCENELPLLRKQYNTVFNTTFTLPNSTKELTYLKDLLVSFKYFDSIALTITKKEQLPIVDFIKDTVREFGLKTKLSIQLIPELLGVEQSLSLIEHLNLKSMSITLLGYKKAEKERQLNLLLKQIQKNNTF